MSGAGGGRALLEVLEVDDDERRVRGGDLVADLVDRVGVHVQSSSRMVADAGGELVVGPQQDRPEVLDGQ